MKENLTAPIRTGIDLGSTTAKMVMLDEAMGTLFSDYKRHGARVVEVITTMLKDALQVLGDRNIVITVTGSAGMGISERYHIPFVQEVIASVETVRELHPDVRTMLDVGGEDSKMVFLDDRLRADMRMNGNCAGGTGAFIDQMATLLGVDMAGMEALASKAQRRHPIASRCGVFAKTDVQSLLARKVPKEEVAASVYHAVAVQTISTLSRGFDPRPRVLFCGGPFAFLPGLREAYREVLGITKEQCCVPISPHLVPATGAALLAGKEGEAVPLSELVRRLSESDGEAMTPTGHLEPLFSSDAELTSWEGVRMVPAKKVPSLKEAGEGGCFLGIDSGSTTSKVILLDSAGKMVFSYYSGNGGDPIGAVRKGLLLLKERAASSGVQLKIARTSVTGYGEDLLRAAFGVDQGMVETLAHFRGASEFLPEVSFVLDIGGQDMKAMKVREGVIEDIELNEACSSGCGSFLETFSNGLGLSVEQFASAACRSRAPSDLGTRCTVFMNSKVKQAQREGATVEDISAGLAYSVAKNCLYKVLKVKDIDTLGENIVVQGGTFRNPAVHRAFEVLLGRKVICSDIPEMMGAYGAALYARDHSLKDPDRTSTFIGLDNLELSEPKEVKEVQCRGCNNNCMVSKIDFGGGRTFYSGNRCERYFHNIGSKGVQGENLVEQKLSLLFDRKFVPDMKPILRIGVPRVLNMYDDLPFWSELLVGCGMEVVLSPPSTQDMNELGSRNVMSENICFPAKLVAGHVKTLAKMGVDRTFMPMVVFEEEPHSDAVNSFICPVITGYPDVIRSSVDPERTLGMPFDSPSVSFKKTGLLKKACWKWLKGLGVKNEVFERAFKEALSAQNIYGLELRQRSEGIVERASERGNVVILLAGRPYHSDPLVSRGIADIAKSLGVSVITEDSIPPLDDGLKNLHVLTQWSYPNRVYNAARWAASKDNVEFVQLNSFGCGPDALVCDEARSILHSEGKHHTLVRIDEVSSPGSIRLRLRSMLESLEMRGMDRRMKPVPRITTTPYTTADKGRKVLIPFLSRFYSPVIDAGFGSAGFDVISLPESDRRSVELGLKHCNNEICYPATIVIGDLLKALESGEYDLDKVAIGISQTGGQCRATSYLSLLKKAMVSSGYKDIPVVAVNIGGQAINYQPGMKFNTTKIIIKGLYGLLFADSISQMYHGTAPREEDKGAAYELSERYIKEGASMIVENRESSLHQLLKKAVLDFNGLMTHDRPVPEVGFVGEIYAKFNPFGNYHVVDWMIKEGIEVVVPPIFDFFAQDYLNHRFHVRANTKSPSLRWLATYPEEWAIRYTLSKYESIRKPYRYYRKAHDLVRISKLAEGSVTLIDQFGEGWLIPAEIGAFSEEGIRNVICVQPFGCISNHIIGKGVEKSLKSRFPDLNVLYLDMDAGSSEVNLYNRLNFMVRAAREDLAGM